MNINPEYVKRAQKLVGKRAWLLGGGQLGNGVILCTVKRITRSGYAHIDAGDANIDRVLLWSWHVEGINPALEAQLGDVPNGDYYFDFKGGLFKQGFFSSTPHYYKTLEVTQ